MATGQDKTEAPTPKRRKQVREEGQVVKSPEVSIAVSLLLSWLLFKAVGENAMDGLKTVLITNFQQIQHPDLTQAGFRTVAMNTAFLMGRILLPIAGALVVTGVIANVLQVGFHVTTKAIKPKLSKLNPLNGVKRIVSVRGLEEFGKGLLKLSLIGFVAFQVISSHFMEFLYLTGSDLAGGISLIIAVAFELLLKVGLAYLVLASGDYGFQKWQFEKEIKMTKQEVKEEARSADMNSEVRGRIKSIQRQLSRKRMMKRVPQADVVITNPTHLAIAIKYDSSKMSAPVVVAKGKRLMAEQIKQIAREAGVPLVENKPLAQALYRAVEVDQEIPKELYKATAEVLAFIYRLKQKAS